jgi:hypothetical protein
MTNDELIAALRDEASGALPSRRHNLLLCADRLESLTKPALPAEVQEAVEHLRDWSGFSEIRDRERAVLHHQDLRDAAALLVRLSTELEAAKSEVAFTVDQAHEQARTKIECHRQEVAALRAEIEEAKSEIERLRPLAKAYEDYIHEQCRVTQIFTEPIARAAAKAEVADG